MEGGTFAEIVRSEGRVKRRMKRFRYPSSKEVAPAYAVMELSVMYDFFMIEGDWIVC